MPEFTAGDIVTLAERPTLAEEFFPQKLRIWQPFMLEDRYSNFLWGKVIHGSPETQLYLVVDNAPVAVAQTTPLVWDGTLGGLPIGWAGWAGARRGRPRRRSRAEHATGRGDFNCARISRSGRQLPDAG